jgi:hypothetical protein
MITLTEKRGRLLLLRYRYRVNCCVSLDYSGSRGFGFTSLLHIPYDKNLFTELNLERYEMTKPANPFSTTPKEHKATDSWLSHTPFTPQRT